VIDLTLLTVGLWAVFVVPANAYIDAGSTTVIFQTVLAALVAGSVTVKLYWRRIVNLFKNGDTGSDKPALSDEIDGPDEDVPVVATEDR
jgi:hypothetical protein